MRILNFGSLNTDHVYAVDRFVRPGETMAARSYRRFAGGKGLNQSIAMPDIMRMGTDRGLRLIFNPAPMTEAVRQYPLDRVSLFILNEIEGRDLTGGADPPAILDLLAARFPRAAMVLTLGADGARYAAGSIRLEIPAEPVRAVDTTAAGDTFAGYFAAAFLEGADPREALRLASRAAAVCVTRPGSAPSIPRRDELGL